MANEQNLHQIIQAAPIGICILDASTLVAEIVNDNFIEVAGRPYEAIFGKHYWDAFPEAKVFYESAMAGVIQTGIPYRANEVQLMLIRYGREELVYVTFVYVPVKDEEGSVRKIAVWVLENTSQVKARQELENAQQVARLAINSADLGVYEYDYTTGAFIADKRFKEIFDDKDFADRDQYVAMIHPADALKREIAHASAIATGHLAYEARLVLTNNAIRWMRLTGRIISHNGTPLKLTGVCQDITSAVIARKKIEESAKALTNIVLQAPVAMCILNGPTFVVQIANHKMFEVWGKRAEDMLHKPIFEGLPEAMEQGFESLLAKVYRTGENFSANERHVMLPRNGEVASTYLNFTYDAIRDADEQITGVLAVAVDVTEQVVARQKIEQIVEERTRKLAAANKDLQKSNDEPAQFAYVASHDLQEPLRKITTFAQLLADNNKDKFDEQSKRHLTKISDSGYRMNKLIKDILSYSELVKERQVFADVNLEEVVRSVAEDYDLLIEQKGAVLSYAGLPVIKAIPLQMSQLFSNLVGNALKFTRNDVQPVISIVARIVTKNDPDTPSLPGDGQYCHIRFTDNGIGIKPIYTEQIFNIFQRLHRKSEFEGTGIGLAMCKKIALNHNGDIDAHGSGENRAVFNIYLPFAQ
jgi:PAS domain S-box-containing protein